MARRSFLINHERYTELPTRLQSMIKHPCKCHVCKRKRFYFYKRVVQALEDEDSNEDLNTMVDEWEETGWLLRCKTIWSSQ